MYWQECDLEESKTNLLSQIEELDPDGYYKNIFTDNGFVDLIYEITNRQWDWELQEFEDHYVAEIKYNSSEFHSEHPDKYYALATAYFDALYSHNDR